MSKTLIPTSIHSANRELIEILFQKRLDALQLEKVLVYLVDISNEDTLYQLAWQFDLLGYKGWAIADTLTKKRELIKGAIELHRYKGTLYAVKRSLQSLGFPTATITEGDSSSWANFKIDLGIGENGIDANTADALAEIINAYKNARSHLTGIEFKIVFDSILSITDDEFYAEPGENFGDELFVGGDFKYDGSHAYDGSMNYSSDTDLLEITIL